MPRLIILPGDNQMLRALVDDVGTAADVRVVESANDVLWEVRQTPPDTLVCDLQPGDMSGLEIAEILPNFDVPTRLVLVSRTDDAQAAQQAAALHVFRFVNNPQSAADVRAAVDAALHAAPQVPAPADVLAPAEPVKSEPAAAPQLSRAERLAQRLAEPAPVSPPPVEPAPPPRQDRLAQRVAQAANTRPSPPPIVPAPPPPSDTGRRRQGPIVLTAERLTPMRSRISDLQRELGAQSILLTDRNGMVLTEIGDSGGIPTMILLPLLSTAFSAAGQISQLLREKDSDALYMQEGSHFDLYCFDIDKTYMLVILFNKNVLASKIGTVWVYTKRAIKDLQEQLR